MTDENTTPNEATNEESPRNTFEEFLYHQRRALEETGRALEALLPEGFRTHSQNASQEFTKGFRVLVDAAMDELKRASNKEASEASSDGNDGGTSTTGKTKVKVQVD